MRKQLKNGLISEHEIQKTVFEWVNLQPTIRDYIFSIPNESATNSKYGKKLNITGRKKGVSDIMIALPRRGYHGAFIELKSENGHLSPAQGDFLNNIMLVGYYAACCWGIDQTIECLSWYCEVK